MMRTEDRGKTMKSKTKKTTHPVAVIIYGLNKPYFDMIRTLYEQYSSMGVEADYVVRGRFYDDIYALSHGIPSGDRIRVTATLWGYITKGEEIVICPPEEEDGI